MSSMNTNDRFQQFSYYFQFQLWIGKPKLRGPLFCSRKYLPVLPWDPLFSPVGNIQALVENCLRKELLPQKKKKF